MPKFGSVIFLRVPDCDDREKFLRDARKVWNHAHPAKKGKGRPSDEERIKGALQKIAQDNCSDRSLGKYWTLKQWVERVRERIDYRHAATQGRATIEKYVKEYVSRGAVVLQHTPISLTKRKPVEEQLREYLNYAIAQAVVLAPDVNGVHSVGFKAVNRLHQDLCTAYIPRRVRPSEAERRLWFTERWKTLRPGKVESRTPCTTRPLLKRVSAPR